MENLFCEELEWCLKNPGKEDQASTRLLEKNKIINFSEIPKRLVDILKVFQYFFSFLFYITYFIKIFKIYGTSHTSTTFPLLRHLIVGGFPAGIFYYLFIYLFIALLIY